MGLGIDPNRLVSSPGLVPKITQIEHSVADVFNRYSAIKVRYLELGVALNSASTCQVRKEARLPVPSNTTDSRIRQHLAFLSKRAFILPALTESLDCTALCRLLPVAAL